MVDVEEEVEVLGILEQADMEQTVLVDVKGNDELVERCQLFGERRLLQLEILDFLHRQLEGL